MTLDTDGNVTGSIGCSSTSRPANDSSSKRRAGTHRPKTRCDGALASGALEFLAEINRVAVSARDYRQLMRAVTAAAVPELGDWCTVHFLPEPGGTPEVELAHVDPTKVEWAALMRQRYPYDPDERAGSRGDPHWSPRVPERSRLSTSPLRSTRWTPTKPGGAMSSTCSTSCSSRASSPCPQHQSAHDRRDAVRECRVGRVTTRGRRARTSGRGACRRSAGQRGSPSSTVRSPASCRPHCPPRLPDVDGLTIAARYWPQAPCQRSAETSTTRSRSTTVAGRS